MTSVQSLNNSTEEQGISNSLSKLQFVEQELSKIEELTDIMDMKIDDLELGASQN
jgi:hypothetical protein